MPHSLSDEYDAAERELARLRRQALIDVRQRLTTQERAAQMVEAAEIRCREILARLQPKLPMGGARRLA